LKKALVGKLNRKRPRGRWVDRIKNDLIKCTQKITIVDGVDRDRWRNIVEATKVLQGPQKLKKKKKT